jgi:rhodanese-related sulfurtransferase
MENITVQELKSRLDAGEKIHILDVREPDEFAVYNIGAKLVPLGNVMSMQVDELEEWKDDEIVVHCHAGKRSLQAAMMLETLGFKHVKNLTGVMVAWQELVGK